ncbi:MAG: hypothetical protein KC636_19960, partial [Myxococcales bacterium]|nr:hypothetical protein [Myxococcales bacterium]
MIRADYCGDGSSWTQPGNSVWVADHLGANQFPLFYPQPADEAVWGLHGALCVDTPRDPAYHNTIVGCWHASGWFWSYDAIPSCSPNASSWYNALFFFDEAVSWTKNTF